MMGYCRETASPPRRQRPFNNSHETTGMLSRQAMGCLQRGQVDGGLTSDRSAGSRTMHTFRKLPRHSPRIAAATSRIGSTATRHLVEQNARRHRDVERLRALRQGNRHTLRGDGVELRPDPGAFVADDHGDGPPPPCPVPRPGRTMQRCAVRCRRPQRDRVRARPRDESRVVERDDRVAEGRAHRRPQRLGADRVGRAAQHHRARGAQRVRRANQCADVPGVLHAVDHERHGPRRGSELGRGPASRLDHRADALRRLRVGALPRRAAAELPHTIAGSDSGGGAGIQADLKTFHQFGVFGTSVITAVTAQNTVGVLAWEPVSEALVTRQLDALAADLPPLAVKSGMLASAALVETVAAGIARHHLPNYVLDPVMVATSGDRLLDEDAEQLVARRLLPLATLVTPNLDEAAILVGEPVATPEAMERAGDALRRRGARAALLKGGHLAGDQVVDVLVTDRGPRRFTRPRLDTTSTHGTGRTLSAAVAAGPGAGPPAPNGDRRR